MHDDQSEFPLTPEQQRRVGELVDEFELVVEERPDVTVEQICVHDPELLDAVGRALIQLSRVDRALQGPAYHGQLTEIGGYKVLDRLDAGGSAVVYRCLQDGIDREVAVKVLKPFVDEREQRRQFEREMAVVRAFQHPGVPAVYDSGTITQIGTTSCWFAMELLTGGRIDEYVRAKQSSQQEVLRLFREVCQTLFDFHQKGMLHRDLKPSNILISGDGRPKVLDFGLARLSGLEFSRMLTESPHMDVRGTPAYMAPELLLGKVSEADVQCEIYSLGVILFSLLAGQHPLGEHSKSVPRMMHKLQNGGLPRLSSVCSEVTCDLDTFVAWMTAYEPASRYRTVGEVIDELNRLLKGEPIAARRVSRGEHFWRFVKRYPVQSVATVVFMAALAILMWRLFVSNQQIRQFAGFLEQRSELLRDHAKLRERSIVSSRLRSVQQTISHDRYLALQQLTDRGVLPVEHRGFAWELLHYLADTERTDLTGLPDARSEAVGFGSIYQLRFDRSGTQLIVASKPRSLSIVDLSTKIRREVPIVVRMGVEPLLHPLKKTFFCQSFDGPLIEVSLETADVVRQVSLTELAAGELAVSSDGRYLVALNTSGQLMRHSLLEDKVVKSTEAVDCAAVAMWMEPDDQHLQTVTRSGEWLRWDLQQLTIVRRQHVCEVIRDKGRLLPNGDDRPLMCACAEYDEAHQLTLVVGMGTGAAYQITSHDDSVTGVQHVLLHAQARDIQFFPPHGMVALIPPAARVFSMGQGSGYRISIDSIERALATSVSPDGNWLAVGGSTGHLELIEYAERALQRQVLRPFYQWPDHQYGAPVRTFRLRQEDRMLIGHAGGWLATVDSESGELLEAIQVRAASDCDMQYCRRTERLIVGLGRGQNSLAILPLREHGLFCETPSDSAEPLERVQPCPQDVREVKLPVRPVQIALAESADRLFVLSRQGRVMAFNTTSWQIEWERPEVSGCRVTSIGAVGDDVCLADAAGQVALLSGSSQQILRSWNSVQASVLKLQYSPGHRVLFAADRAGHLHLLPLENRPQRKLLGHSERVLSLAISSDGSTLASGGYDGQLILWDGQTGELQMTLDAHTGPVTDLRFADDDESLVSASRDGTVKIWGKPQDELLSH